MILDFTIRCPNWGYQHRADADRRLPILLRLQALRHALEAEGRRLLRFLLFGNGPLPTGSGGWRMLQVSLVRLPRSRARGQKAELCGQQRVVWRRAQKFSQDGTDGFETPRRYKSVRLRRLRHLIRLRRRGPWLPGRARPRPRQALRMRDRVRRSRRNSPGSASHIAYAVSSTEAPATASPLKASRRPTWRENDCAGRLLVNYGLGPMSALYRFCRKTYTRIWRKVSVAVRLSWSRIDFSN